MPRIDSRKCSLDRTKGKNKTDLPTYSKWQIGLFLWHKPYRGGCGHRRGSEASPLGEYPEGVSPSGRFFGDFLIGEKVTRVQGGAPAGGCRDYQSCKKVGQGADHGKAMLSRSARSLRVWELCSHKGSAEGLRPSQKRARGEAPKNWDTSRSRQSPCNSPGRSRPRC